MNICPQLKNFYNAPIFENNRNLCNNAIACPTLHCYYMQEIDTDWHSKSLSIITYM